MCVWINYELGDYETRRHFSCQILQEEEEEREKEEEKEKKDSLISHQTHRLSFSLNPGFDNRPTVSHTQPTQGLVFLMILVLNTNQSFLLLFFGASSSSSQSFLKNKSLQRELRRRRKEWCLIPSADKNLLCLSNAREKILFKLCPDSAHHDDEKKPHKIHASCVWGRERIPKSSHAHSRTCHVYVWAAGFKKWACEREKKKKKRESQSKSFDFIFKKVSSRGRKKKTESEKIQKQEQSFVCVCVCACASCLTIKLYLNIPL